MLQAGPLLSLSPSFNSYSSSVGNLAEIAARVVSELRRENSDSAAMFLYDDDVDDLDQPWQLHHDDHDRRFRLHEERLSSSEPSVKEQNDSEDDGEFEFALAGRESPSSPISADEIFHNGQIRPVYPIFGKPSHILLEESSLAKSAEGNDKTALRPPLPPPPAAAPRRRQPLRMLMVEEEWASCSSSEADELEGLPSGTYCVWAPKSVGDRKKSKSTGATSSSKRWKLRDLILSRSNSGGKVAGKGTAAVETEPEAEEKKSSTGPYNKKELLGFLGNVNGLSKNLHPF